MVLNLQGCVKNPRRSDASPMRRAKAVINRGGLSLCGVGYFGNPLTTRSPDYKISGGFFTASFPTAPVPSPAPQPRQCRSGHRVSS